MDHQTVGNFAPRAVVVGDDDLDARTGDGLHLVQIGDAAVHRDQQITALGVLEHLIGVDAVALVEAVRNEGVNVCAQRPQTEQQHARGGDAVGVVVTVNTDALSRVHRPDDALRRPFERRIGGQGQLTPQQIGVESS